MMDFMAKLNTLLLQSTKKNYKEKKNRERKTKKKKGKWSQRRYSLSVKHALLL